MLAWFITMERGDEMEKGYEVINLGFYGFEWFIDGELVRSGLIEDLEETISMLEDEGFVKVE